MRTVLGPQCYTCRKRQVKCDSSKPACRRCCSDNITCRGYEGQLKIITYNPSRHVRRKKPKPDHARAATDNAEQSSAPLAHLVQQYPSSDPDYLALLESFRYYDSHVLPRTLPGQSPFERKPIDRHVPWHVLPKVVQHFMIVATRSMCAGAQDPSPALRLDICYYRGLGLSELQPLVSGAVTDQFGIVLACTLMLMGADMQLSAPEAWLTHFSAAQKIVSLRGGLKNCIKDLPNFQNLLVIFAVSDIFTSTTCNSTDLRSSVEAQKECLLLLPAIHTQLLAYGCPCPPAILQEVIRTNMLRAKARSSSLHTFEDIWQSIDTFDPAAWAISTLERAALTHYPVQFEQTIDPDSVSSLTSFGNCYRCAALLYLSLSCPLLSAASIPIDPTLTWSVLAEHISLLFEMASTDPDGPLPAQLWKFLAWPLIISAYACTGWHFPSPERHADAAERDLSRLRAIAVALGASRLLAAVDHLQNLRVRRANRKAWTWDVGFPFRFSFGV